jgi:hypothetical protein
MVGFVGANAKTKILFVGIFPLPVGAPHHGHRIPGIVATGVGMFGSLRD